MYIGFDVGGTNLKIGVINDNGELIYQNTKPTFAAKGLGHVMSSIKKLIKDTIEKYPESKSIGLGVPGVISTTGTVMIAPNLQGWVDVPLYQILYNQFSLPIKIDNDANAAAKAELELGAAKIDKNFIYVTLGTGVGGAIVINREIFRGDSGGAGEIGHLVIDSNIPLYTEKPYRTGILEEFIGRNQITSYAYDILEEYPNSILHSYKRPDPYFVTEAVYKNDEAAIKIFEDIGTYLGIGLASAMNFLDISVIIVGGGISQAHPLLLETALKTIKKRVIPPIAERADVRQATFTKDAGIIGSALLGKQNLEKDRFV
jgi:glucokinase